MELWSDGVGSDGAMLENTTGVFKSLIETRNKRAEQAFWKAGQRLDYSITPLFHCPIASLRPRTGLHRYRMTSSLF
jgi:hypothetical protein